MVRCEASTCGSRIPYVTSTRNEYSRPQVVVQQTICVKTEFEVECAAAMRDRRFTDSTSLEPTELDDFIAR